MFIVNPFFNQTKNRFTMLSVYIYLVSDGAGFKCVIYFGLFTRCAQYARGWLVSSVQ